MRIYDDPIVFPRPLVTTAFPPPLECMCTWAYSPRIFGTVDKPYVLKLYYGLCPVRGHRTRASVGLAIDWALERKRQEENARESGHKNSNAKSTQSSRIRSSNPRRTNALSKAKKRQKIRQAEEIEARKEYL